MNGLLGEARAIVTDIPGTTRDTIEEDLVLAGIPLRLVDTAGIRNTDDPVEKEGVRRARIKVDSADLILLVIDGSTSLTDDDLLALDFICGRDVLVVLNKSDLGSVPIASALEGFSVVRVSALDGKGLDALIQAIQERFSGSGTATDIRETVVITDRRHRQALLLAREALSRFRKLLAEGLSPSLERLNYMRLLMP